MIEVRARSRGKDEIASGPIPLLIGVAGHRDLRPADVPRLRKGVVKVFRAIRRRYRHSRVVLLSSLADGADRLAAWAALETGCGLIAVLPMSRGLYANDFEGRACDTTSCASSAQEFEMLLSRAEACIEMPLRPGRSADMVASEADARNEQYAEAGLYIVDHCQFLLALWDGVDSPKVGGTAHVVKFQLEGKAQYRPAERDPLAPTEQGPVLQIVTPRASGTRVPDKSFHKRAHVPARSPRRRSRRSFLGLGADLDDQLKQLDAFNQEAAKQLLRDGFAIKASARELLPEALQDQDALFGLIEIFACADSAAQRFRAVTIHALYALFWTAFVLATLFDLYAHGPHAWVALTQHHGAGDGGADEAQMRFILMEIYLAVMLLVWAVGLKLHWGRRWQSCHQDYRALAEALRVQVFWCWAGLTEPVAGRYLLKQRGELEWIRRAVRAAALSPLAACRGAVLTAERLQVLSLRWVDAQRDYFTRSTAREMAAAGRFHFYMRLAFTMHLMIVGMILGLFWLPHAGPESALTMRWEPLLTLLAPIPAVLAGLIHGLAEKRAFAVHARHYGNLGVIYARAADELKRVKAPDDLPFARLLLRRLGEEALYENADWLLMHRERELELLHAEGAKAGTLMKLTP